MKISTNLKEDLQYFIEERLQESYLKASNKVDYKENYNKYRELETRFIESLQNETMVEDYYYFRDIRLDLDTRELQEAYLMGFKDSTMIEKYFD